MGALILENIIKKLEQLPDDVQLEANNVLDAFLKAKQIGVESIVEDAKETEPLRRPVFGSGKGMFGKMADDFDEPLEDFKDYM